MRGQSLLLRLSIRQAILGCAGVAGLISPSAHAQDANAAAANTASGEEVEEVVVTGFRASLQSATNAKRESVGFSDSVFAEDIGKFPDLNIAESLNRIPGVQLSREVNGEGLNVAIRGLNTNFTKTTINGARCWRRVHGPRRRPGPESRGRSRPVPNRTVHAPRREQVAQGESARRRRGRHGGHAYRASVRQSGHAFQLSAAGQLQRGKRHLQSARRPHGELDRRQLRRAGRVRGRRQRFDHHRLRNHRLYQPEHQLQPVRRGTAAAGSRRHPDQSRPRARADSAIATSVAETVGSSPTRCRSNAGAGLAAGQLITGAYLQQLNPA